VDGYGFHGFLTQSLDNPAMRRKYGLTDEQTGILVHKVYANSPATNKIQIGDIVTQIDGHKIENNGTVEFRPGEFIDHTHYIDMHQIGDNLNVTVIRNGETKDIALHLDKPGQEYLLVKPKQYDKQPTYFIFGGYVFMPLNQDLVDSMENLPARIGALTYEAPDEKRSEAVLLTKVLPADINKDHHQDANLVLEKINGEPVKNFNDFYTKIQNSTDDFITLETSDDYQIIIDRKEAIARQPKILAQYGIANDRSKDLGNSLVATPTPVNGDATPVSQTQKTDTPMAAVSTKPHR
jgi:S1-C subfamily serine protease